MDQGVLEALADARTLGFLGPGPIEDHVAHAGVFAEALHDVLATPEVGRPSAEVQALDLGSGGGVPGLLLAWWFPDVRWVLLDVHRRRTSFLTRAVAELGWAGRVAVARREAAEAGADPELRARCAVVTARSFGRPARTAECGAAFLAEQGRLLVADPPEGRGERWPADGLAALGLEDDGLRQSAAGTVRMLRQAQPLDPRFPRPRRKMEQQPLW
ncbi:MAG: class I SAM-dependent methyltransferase [Actinomycetota bacterium]|nr:class I SAM-dependent methyltransferase [Actinomycetota bacterium]